MNIKEFAKAYEPQKMKLISDLDSVDASIEFQTEVREANEKDEQGNKKKYTVNFLVINEEEYRVPISVIEQLKGIIEAKPDLKTFKVVKTGTGMNTKYQVIPL